jgi:HK97 family phage major capsid protein
MNLADRIKASEDELVQKKDQLVAATQALEAAPDESSLLVQVEELTKGVEKHEATLGALKKAEAALAARARPVDGAPAIVSSQYKDPKGKPGDIIMKHGVCSLLAFAQKRTVEDVMQERYGDQPYVKATFDLVHKSQVNPAMTNVQGWAAELVRDDVRGFMTGMADVSVAAALASRTLMMTFDGAQSVTIPRRNRPVTPGSEPAWVGEGAPIPLTQFSFGSTKMERYKLAAISTFTKEIAQRSTPAIEALLREALREAYAEVLDAALLGSGAAVAGLRPAGLLNGVTPATGTAGGGEDAVRGDILAAVTAMTTARVGARPVMLINNLDRLGASMMTTALSDYLFREELAQGLLLGIPVIASANVPQHTMVLVDAAYLATAFDAPEWDVSDVATVVESNADATPPTHAAVAAGTAGTAGQVPSDGGIPVHGATAGAAVAGYKARSLWQTYSIGVRMVAPTSWAITMPGAVQAATATTWTP